MMLLGTADPNSPLRLLRGNKDVLKIIFEVIVKFWIGTIDRQLHGFSVVPPPLGDVIKFPPPQGIMINMMPFIPSDLSSLPKEYHQYWGMIEACRTSDRIKVCYLTIHESETKEGCSQRRGGLHTESPGSVSMGQGLFSESLFNWGGGFMARCGGIFMASNVSNSCRVWDVRIKDLEHVAGRHGDIEHLRTFIGRGEDMPADVIYWITDCTPHESLPLKKTQMRQFFRLVTNQVSGWFAKHSTRNPLGIEPDCEIIEFDKFA